MTRLARIRRGLTTLVLVAGAVWFGPGAAAVGESITFKCTGTQTPSPSQRECTPASAQAINGKWKVAFNVKAPTGQRIRRVELRIISRDPNNILSPGQTEKDGPIEPVAKWGDAAPDDWRVLSPSTPETKDLSYEWDTPVLTPLNGAFDIFVQAEAHTTKEAWSGRRDDVRVDHTPPKPAKPVVTLATSDGVTIDWVESSDPQFRSYKLYRAKTGAAGDRPQDDDFKGIQTITDRSKTRLFDDVTKAGAYWYRIQTVRASVVPNNEPGDPQDEKCPCTIASALSDTSERAGLVVPATPAPEPTPEPATPEPPPTPKPPPKQPRIIVRPPPVPDAPFSAVLPYPDDPEVGPAEAEPPPQPLARPTAAEPDPTGSRAGVLPVAVGAFLISAALLLGRLPV